LIYRRHAQVRVCFFFNAAPPGEHDVAKHVCIISGGMIDSSSFLKKSLSDIPDAIVVCADGGARHCAAAGIVPAVIVGDMDSADPATVDAFVKQGSVLRRYSPDKDETDTELALEHAFSLAPDSITIFGALGGRIDHTVANVSLLAAAAKRGIDARIRDKSCEAFVLTGTGKIRGTVGETVSLLPLSERVTGITLTGFRYPLENAVMTLGTPIGISNRLVQPVARIAIESGYLLVIRSFDAA